MDAIHPRRDLMKYLPWMYFYVVVLKWAVLWQNTTYPTCCWNSPRFRNLDNESEYHGCLDAKCNAILFEMTGTAYTCSMSITQIESRLARYISHSRECFSVQKMRVSSGTSRLYIKRIESVRYIHVRSSHYMKNKCRDIAHAGKRVIRTFPAEKASAYKEKNHQWGFTKRW